MHENRHTTQPGQCESDGRASAVQLLWCDKTIALLALQCSAYKTLDRSQGKQVITDQPLISPLLSQLLAFHSVT